MTASAIVTALVVVFLILLTMERLVPLRSRTRSFVPRFALNLVLSALAFLVASQLVTPVALALTGWTSENSFGLLPLIQLPPAAEGVLGFLLMDLSFYYWHRANHRFRFLWRFHNVHHIDPDLDVSTAVRFHFGEIFLSTGFRISQVTMIGVSLGTYLIYEAAFQGNTLFHHSNVRLPIGVERFLNKVLVTPRMHAIHHSAIQNETNSDYSTVFCWWDRLHGTLRLNVPQSQITIGVPAYQNPEDNTIWTCLVLPFQKQREYWRSPDGTVCVRDPSVADMNRSRLVE